MQQSLHEALELRIPKGVFVFKLLLGQLWHFWMDNCRIHINAVLEH